MAMLNFGGVQVMGWSSKYPSKKPYPETTWQPVASLSLRWKCWLSFFDGSADRGILEEFIFWLVVEPTHLKNMIVKLEIFPKVRGEKSKNIWNHQLDVGYFSIPTTTTLTPISTLNKPEIQV